MNIRTLTQEILDNTLLTDGILSHHLRRVEVEEIRRGNRKITVNKDEYIVYRVVSNKGREYGDGNAQLEQYYIDVNYYYAYDKNDRRVKNANARIKSIISAFLADGRFRVANGQSDIFDFDNPYRGINVEFLFIGVVDNGG